MPASTIDQLRELIVQVGGDGQKARDLDADQAVAHNALDSLGFTAFIAAIEERFAIRVSTTVKLRSLERLRPVCSRGNSSGRRGPTGRRRAARRRGG
ncbi:MAG: acyl carrier protein [Syntrophotaleaceae bacterium]